MWANYDQVPVSKPNSIPASNSQPVLKNKLCYPFDVLNPYEEIMRLQQLLKVNANENCSKCQSYDAQAKTILELQNIVKKSDEKLKKLGVIFRELEKSSETFRENLDKIADLGSENQRIRQQLRNRTRIQHLLEGKKQRLETLISEKDKEIQSLKESLKDKNGESKSLIRKVFQLNQDLRLEQEKLDKVNKVAEDFNKKYNLQNEQIYNLNSQNKFFKQKLEKLQDQFKLSQRTMEEDFVVSIDDLES